MAVDELRCVNVCGVNTIHIYTHKDTFATHKPIAFTRSHTLTDTPVILWLTGTAAVMVAAYICSIARQSWCQNNRPVFYLNLHTNTLTQEQQKVIHLVLHRHTNTNTSEQCCCLIAIAKSRISQYDEQMNSVWTQSLWTLNAKFSNESSLGFCWCFMRWSSFWLDYKQHDFIPVSRTLRHIVAHSLDVFVRMTTNMAGSIYYWINTVDYENCTCVDAVDEGFVHWLKCQMWWVESVLMTL